MSYLEDTANVNVADIITYKWISWSSKFMNFMILKMFNMMVFFYAWKSFLILIICSNIFDLNKYLILIVLYVVSYLM